MRAYWQSRWVRIGVTLLVLGTSPLVFIIAAAAVGLWPERDPNPVGPGLLFALSFWLAVVCILIGGIRVNRSNRAPRLPDR